MNESLKSLGSIIVFGLIIFFGIANMFETSECDVINGQKVCTQKSGVSMFVDWVRG